MECARHLGYELPTISKIQKCPACGTPKEVVTGYFCKVDGEEFNIDGESLGIPPPPQPTKTAVTKPAQASKPAAPSAKV